LLKKCNQIPTESFIFKMIELLFYPNNFNINVKTIPSRNILKFSKTFFISVSFLISGTKSDAAI